MNRYIIQLDMGSGSLQFMKKTTFYRDVPCTEINIKYISTHKQIYQHCHPTIYVMWFLDEIGIPIAVSFSVSIQIYEIKTEVFQFLSVFHLCVPVDNLYVHVFQSRTFAVKNPRNLTQKTHMNGRLWNMKSFKICLSNGICS